MSQYTYKEHCIIQKCPIFLEIQKNPIFTIFPKIGEHSCWPDFKREDGKQ